MEHPKVILARTTIIIIITIIGGGGVVVVVVRVHKSSKLVDPASDHILRSKTKPCMSKTKQVVSESAYGSINEPSPTREQSTTG